MASYGSGLLDDMWAGYSQKRATTGRPLTSREMRGLISPILANEVQMAREAAVRDRENRSLVIQEQAQKDSARAANVSGGVQIAGLLGQTYNTSVGNAATSELAKAKLAEAAAIRAQTTEIATLPYRGTQGLVGGAPGPGITPVAPTVASVAAPTMAPVASSGAGLLAAPATTSTLSGAGAGAAPVMAGQSGLAVQGASGMTYGAGGTATATTAAETAAPAAGMGAVIGPAAIGGGIGSYLGGRFHDKLGVNEDIGQGIGGVVGGALAGTAIMPGIGTVVGGVVGGVISLVDDLF